LHTKRIIGFYGFPPRWVTEEFRDIYPDNQWVDLDIDFGNPDSGILPDNYCRILRNIMDNAVFLKESIDIVIASTGSEKCEGGRYIAYLLKEMGFRVAVTRNDSDETSIDSSEVYVPISKSGLPLATKIDLIMKTVLEDSRERYDEVQPSYGFWGVPPHDFELLKLFPDTTHVYGWTRCVEAGRPSNLNLECYVEPLVPTVFFVQSFCAKSQLARYLAEKHGGLFVDADGPIGMGTRAKIEAFLELNKPK